MKNALTGESNVYESSQNGNEHRNSKHHFIFDCAGCAVYFIHRKGAKDGGSHQNDRRYVRIE